MKLGIYLALCCVFAVGATARDGGAEEGRAAPTFELRDVDGVSRRLADYRGKWVVLEWVNFDCPPVAEFYSAPARRMQALQRTFKSKGVVWFSINSAGVGKRGHLSPQQGKATLARLGAEPTALLLDTAGTAGKAFGARVAPEVRVISPRGDVVYAGGVESFGEGTPVRYLETVLNAAVGGRAIPYAAKSIRGCRINYGDTTPAATPAATPPAASAASGPRAPEFTLVDSTGVTRRLSDYRGKWVILEWVNYDCPFVQMQYQSPERSMQTLQASSARQGIVWLSICSSARGKEGFFSSSVANGRKQRLGATPTAYLHDPTGSVGRSYGARKTPDMRIISPQGTIEYAGGIDSSMGRRVPRGTRVQNYVALALADIAAGRPIGIKRSPPFGCSVKY